jgi:hypothetical protein
MKLTSVRTTMKPEIAPRPNAVYICMALEVPTYLGCDNTPLIASVTARKNSALRKYAKRGNQPAVIQGEA